MHMQKIKQRHEYDAIPNMHEIMVEHMIYALRTSCTNSESPKSRFAIGISLGETTIHTIARFLAKIEVPFRTRFNAKRQNFRMSMLPPTTRSNDLFARLRTSAAFIIFCNLYNIPGHVGMIVVLRKMLSTRVFGPMPSGYSGTIFLIVASKTSLPNSFTLTDENIWRNSDEFLSKTCCEEVSVVSCGPQVSVDNGQDTLYIMDTPKISQCLSWFRSNDGSD